MVVAGAVLKMVADMSEPTSAYFSMDVECDQSHLWSTPTYETGLTELWEKDRYFRVPTYETAG